MVADAGGPDDHVAFVTSSHGSGDGKGNSYLCMLPDPKIGTTACERAGQYWDYELAADLGGNGHNQSRTMVFIDACFSGIVPADATIAGTIEGWFDIRIAVDRAPHRWIYHVHTKRVRTDNTCMVDTCVVDVATTSQPFIMALGHRSFSSVDYWNASGPAMPIWRNYSRMPAQTM